MARIGGRGVEGWRGGGQEGGQEETTTRMFGSIPIGTRVEVEKKKAECIPCSDEN